MYIDEILDYLKCGKKIRRTSWPSCFYFDKKEDDFNLSVDDLLADDWEILEEKYKWWEPEPGDAYWSLEYNGVPWKSTDEDEWNEGAIAIGNYFTSCDEADFIAKKLEVIHELRKFAYQQDGGKIDWYDKSQGKFFVAYNLCDKKVDVAFSNSLVVLPFHIYFDSEEIAKKAIATIGEDRIKKYYFGVEENGRK